MESYDTAMFKNFLKATLATKQDYIRYLKDNYVVIRQFWTEKGDQIKVGSLQNPTIISCHKIDGKLFHQYKHINSKNVQSIVTVPIDTKNVDMVPDGYMQKSIDVIKTYINQRAGMSLPEVTLISENRYRINIWNV